jgi:hypothetical protein
MQEWFKPMWDTYDTLWVERIPEKERIDELWDVG